MKRKRMLQLFLDTQLKGQIQNIFGKNSCIVINNLTHVRSKDCYLINTTLYVNSLEDFEVLYPTSLISFIKLAWSVVGHKKEIIVQSSFDLVSE
jgi:hypothetical protein